MSDQLTTAAHWRWRGYRKISEREVLRVVKNKSSWVHKAQSFMRPEDSTILELGCAPGRFSLYLAYREHMTGTDPVAGNLVTAPPNLQGFGVDFSEDADTYLETMKGLGPQATLYKEDIFTFNPGRQFDIVFSGGLVEHFRGQKLYELLRIHDKHLKPGGLLIIQMPNFTGFHHFWHWLWDKPDLDNHNLLAMRPETFNVFREIGYKTLYCRYIEQIELWGVSRFKWNGRHTPFSYAVGGMNKALSIGFRLLRKAGVKLEGRFLSPSLLYVGRKPHPSS